MSSIDIAKTYAQCLYSTAEKKAIQTQVYNDICLVVSLYNKHPSLHAFLRNPIRKVIQKQQIIQRTLQPHLHPQTLDFLLFVIKKRRYNNLPAIMKAFVDIYKRSNKIYIANVTTPQKLTPELKKQLTILTAKIVDSPTIELVEHINPALLGGYVLQIGDKQIDASLRTKLQKLKHFWVDTNK